MRIVVLTENTACRKDVTAQHGLSLYMETNGCRLLMDMGQDDTFARNAQALGIDLSQVDIAVLSHGHYDHGGGLRTFLEINRNAPVYVHRHAFGKYYNGKEKYIGLDPELQGDPRLILTEGTAAITPQILLSDCNDRNWPIHFWGLNQREADGYLPDRFCHEQYLQITEGEKRILLSGCSHKGIENIAAHFRPDVLIGGFHLNKQEDEMALKATAAQLLEGTAVYYTGHCTGAYQYGILKEVMADRLHPISAGDILSV